MIQSKIQQYIQSTCTPKQLAQGRKIHSNNAVLDVEYDQVEDEGNGVVKGSKKYRVAVLWLFHTEYAIESYCDCEEGLNHVCKHQVAVLIELQTKFKSLSSELHENFSQNEFGVPINALTFENYHPTAVLNTLEIKLVQVLEALVIFSVEVKSSSRQLEKKIITISRKGSTWFLENCCNPSLKSYCKHQLGIIYFVRKQLRGYRFFEKLMDLELEKYEASKMYHLPENGVFDHFFELRFDAEAYEFCFVPVNKSIQSKYDLFLHIEKFQETKKRNSSIHLPLKLPNENGFGHAISFHFFPRSRRKFNPFIATILTGKLNKERTNLVHSFAVFNQTQVVPDEVRLFVDELNYLMNLQSVNDNYIQGFNEIAQYLKQHVSLLADVITYENEESYMVSKTSITPLFFQKNPLKIILELTEKEDFFVFTGALKTNENCVDFNSSMELKGGHFLTFENQVWIISDYMQFELCKTLIQHAQFVIHKEEQQELVQWISLLSGSCELRLNDIVPVSTFTLNTPRLQVYLSEQYSFLMIRPEVQYEDGKRYSLLDQSTYFEVDENQEGLLSAKRNVPIENQFKVQLTEFDSNFRFDLNLDYFYKRKEELLGEDWFYRFFSFCHAHSIEVFGAKDLKKYRYTATSPIFSATVTSTIDWFEVHFTFRIGTEILTLKKVQEAIESQRKFIRLSDGSLGLIPEKWIKKLQSILSNGEVEAESVRLNRAKFAWVNTAFESQEIGQIQEELSLKMNRLSSFDSIQEVEIPKKFKGKLRNYQKEGFLWLNFLDEFNLGGCLSDEMGLGKTVQLIAFLAKQKELKNGTSLIIVPKSLLNNWSAELTRFCPSLTYRIHHGSQRKFENFHMFDVVVTTYSTVLQDIVLLQNYMFNYVVLDESQVIKNPISQRFKSVCLLKSRNRLIATGTPIENSTIDLFAQFSFLIPGFFGTLKKFKLQYSEPIDGKGDIAKSAELKKMLYPLMLRRTKAQVAQELPPKTEQFLTVEMGENQRKVYDFYLNQIRSTIVTKVEQVGLNHSKLYILDGLTKLRQICNSPSLLKESPFDTSDSAKIELLVEQIKPLVQTNKVLVFSQFTSMLQLIEERFVAEQIPYHYLDGKSKNRMELVDAFNVSESPSAFLISLKAGGVGLNLTSADYVFLIDPWWNPAVESQAIDRTHRIGQQNQVFAYKLICADTIEEKIVLLQAKKKNLSDDLIQVQESFIQQLNQSDLLFLFSN